METHPVNSKGWGHNSIEAFKRDRHEEALCIAEEKPGGVTVRK